MLLQWSRKRKRKRDSRHTLAPFVLIFFCAILNACSESAKPPSPTPITPKPVQKQAVVSAPTATAPQQKEEPAGPVYAYNPTGRIDPFAPIIQKETKKGKGDRPPLERHNITEFKLAGIVWGGFGYNAMLEGPDGKGYFVRVGMVVGPNGGIIKKITQQTLIIEEKFKTFTGQTERKEIVVELRKRQEAAP